jgi:hypothetical protein
MPYFRISDTENILYIHVPRTGGTSIEKYFSEKYKIKFDIQMLYNSVREMNLQINETPLQHQPFPVLYKYRDFFGIDFSKVNLIFMTVRNPYDRILSILNSDFIESSSKAERLDNIFNQILTIPQHHFILPQTYYLNDIYNQIDENDKLEYEMYKNKIKLVKLEDIEIFMKENDFEDFISAPKHNLTNNNITLNDLSKLHINLINLYYNDDFSTFGYTMINLGDIH